MFNKRHDGVVVIGGKDDKKEDKSSVYLNKDYEKLSKFDDSGFGTTGSCGGYGTTGYNNRTYVRKDCVHHGDKVVWEFEDKQLCGAKREDITIYGADLIIDLVGLNITGASRFVLESQSALEFKDLNNFIIIPKILRLDWRDYSAPDGVPLTFWKEVWKRLPVGKTIIACQGGHGRTGTCIASLMIANGITYKDAIKHVRKEHCVHAIESAIQEDYLENLDIEYQLAADDNNDVRVEIPQAPSIK